MAQLINVAEVNGLYQGVGVDDTTQAIVELTALSIEKSADRQIWVGTDELEYRIVVENIDESTPPEVVENVVITDTIDITIATLVTGSLTLTVAGTVVDNPVFQFDDTTGELTVTVGELQSRETAILTFRVEKV